MEENKNKLRIINSFFTIFLTILITFLVTLYGYHYYLKKSGALLQSYKENTTITKSLDVLRSYIENNYKGEINEKDLEIGALKGYVDGLGDDYTVFMDKEEWGSLEESLSSEYTGIGVYLQQNLKTGESIITGSTGDDSPAFKAGIKAGDIIVEVNGENVEEKELEYITSKVKGEEGTTVNVKIKRENQFLDFTIERKKLKISQISTKMLDNNIGYIYLKSFTEDSYNQFKNGYDSLKNQGAKKLIVDLRENGGGYVQSALDIADLFVDKDKVLLVTEDKNGKKEYTNSKTDKVIDMDVVFLVNENSASASEILSGIIKDYKVGKIIGTTTYGKGVIQDIIEDVLGGALKITISEYYTPKENKINKIGIKPDIEVELDMDSTTDTQLDRAIEELK